MSDILLSFGVQKGTADVSRMRTELEGVLNQINNNPPKVNVGLQVDKTALAHFKTQLTQIVNSISLSNGAPLTISISGIGAVTAKTAILKDNIDGVATAMKETAEAATDMAQAVADANATAASSAAKSEKAEQERKATVAEVMSAYKTLDGYITKNSRIVDTDEGQQLIAIRDNLYQIYQASLTSADGLASISKQDFKNLINQCNALRIGLKDAGKEGKTAGQALRAAYEKFGGWMLVTRSLTAIIRGFKAMLDNVVSIDTAMTELKKVTSETDVTYDNFLTKASSRAKQLGTTISDVVTATADFARLGYGIDDASRLADAAIIYKNVGDGIEDIGQASESVISTMQAFGIEASNAMGIVDRFNEVGNNYAISSVGIGDALQRSAAAMAAANNTLDETIALITAANTIVQNPDSVGTTLKTVSMFLRAAKTEAEEAGESTEGMANSVSELREELLALTGGKVDIQIDEDNFKGTYQILKELSAVWGELTDISKANILEMVGGKRNSNVVSALLANFEIAEKALKTSADAAGSALAENEKYLESISGKLEKFQSSIEAFSTSVIDSELVKLVVDLGTGLFDVLTTLQQIHLLMPLIAASAVAIAGAKNMSALSEAMSKVNTITNSVVSSMREQGSVSHMVAMAVAGLTNKEKALLVSQIESAVASGTITSAQASQTMATLGLVSAEGTLVVTNKGLAASFKSLMASIPVWGWIALVITGVIEAVTALTDAVAKNKQEMIDDANAIVDAYESANGTYQSNISSLENLRARFEQLSQGVDENGERVSLTADEYDEYLSLVKQICNISPSVVQGYDNEGRAIVNYTNLLNDAIASQKEYIDNQRNIYLGKGKDIFDGKAEEYRQMQEELADAGEELGNAFNTIGFFETLFDPDRATAVHNAYHDVFEKLGIEFKTGVDTWTTSFDALSQMYEKHDEIIAMLGETGEYTEEELNGISNAIHGLAGAYTSLNAIEGEQVDYLMEWVKDKDWYNSIPLGALDEMRAGLAGVNNPLLSFNENLSATEQYGKAFADAIQSDAVKGIMDMSNGLSDGSVSIESYNAAVANLKDSWDGDADVLPMIIAFLYSLTNGYSSSGDAAETAATKVKTFADAITNLQDAYTLLDKAMEEMEDGGLSVETIKEIAEQVDNLTDYLYIESGAIKLNTQAWREYAKAKVAGDIAGIQSSIQKLEEDNKALEAKKKEYEANRAMGSDGGTWNNLIIQQDNAIAENNKKIAENQELLDIYNTLYADITADLDAYTASLQNFSNVSDAITSISDGLTTVADIQETVAKGFTISLEKALEFAKVYPEILNGATVAADGQIALNEGIVNAFIEGKEAELKAQIDAEVAKLEADKAVLTAKMEFSKAQLELAKSVGTGEGQIAKDVAEYRVNTGNAVAEALIAAGIDEATAYQLACAAMAQNSEEFNRVAKDVCTDVQGNFNQAAYDAAQAIYKNMQNSKMSIASVAAQAHQAALAIAGIGSGKVQGSATVNGSEAGGTYTSKGNISVTSGSFKGTEYTYEAKEISLEDFISDLELDISNYSKAISQIDGQIATLKALRNTSLDKFATSNKSGSGGSKSKEETWFEKEYTLHQHLLKMDAENVEDYLDWLNEAYQRAYKEGIIDLDEYYKYQEEVYTGLQDLFKDYLSDVEHEISMRENYDGEAKKIIELYEGLIAKVEKEIADARARGLTDEDDYIQELQKKWQDYTGSIEDLRDEITESAKDALDELIDYRIDMLKQEIEDEKDALDKRLDNLKEFYDKQKEMLQDQRDEENYLKDQSEKRKTVTDLQAELAMLANDDSAWAQKRKLELQEEITTAQEDLDEFEKDHALDLALDALDKAYNDQEAQLQSEMDALEERLNDPEALYNKALEDIRKNSENQLYYQMLMYNRQYGDGNDETVKDLLESAFGALSDYEKLFGELYKGVDLENETGVEDDGGWDDETISGTNPDNQQPTPPPPADDTAKEETATPRLTDDIKKKVAAAIWNGGYGWGTGSTRTQRLTEVFGANNGIQALVNKGVGRSGVSLTNEYTYANMRKKFKGYAAGTLNAIPGLHRVDEFGPEYLFVSPSDGTRYRMFTGGEKVLNADATDFLYQFANSGGTVLTKMLADLFKVGGLGNIAKPVQAIEIHSGDVIVQGNATERTVSEIRRAQRDNLSFVLHELNRLNK